MSQDFLFVYSLWLFIWISLVLSSRCQWLVLVSRTIMLPPDLETTSLGLFFVMSGMQTWVLKMVSSSLRNVCVCFCTVTDLPLTSFRFVNFFFVSLLTSFRIIFVKCWLEYNTLKLFADSEDHRRRRDGFSAILVEDILGIQGVQQSDCWCWRLLVRSLINHILPGDLSRTLPFFMLFRVMLNYYVL